MKWKRWAIGAVVVLLVAYPAAWLLILNSDAFREAERFVRQSPAVQEYVGDVRRVSVSPFGGQMQVSGGRGSAHFDLKVSGELRDADVYAELEKKGIWEVRFARLLRENESPIQLQ